MHAPDGPEHVHDQRTGRVAQPRPPDDLPAESSAEPDDDDDDAMRRADAANGEPDASR
jgi:hypothetical protein